MTASVSLRLGVRAGGRLKGQVCLWEWRAWIGGLGRHWAPPPDTGPQGGKEVGRVGGGVRRGSGWRHVPWGSSLAPALCPPCWLVQSHTPQPSFPPAASCPSGKSSLPSCSQTTSTHPTPRPKRMTQPEPRTGCLSTTSSPSTCSSGWSSQEVSPVPGGCARAASAHTSSGPGSAHMPF